MTIAQTFETHGNETVNQEVVMPLSVEELEMVGGGGAITNTL